ncbi:hypothetical protein [Bacillus seohaeanensis]|jgi:hypothetical protein|uniref:Uncharacterized protein n=1 Tax=Bacillus seohaeanensis TaxID=284580 RepID=A0ABW5RMY0_9BACI
MTEKLLKKVFVMAALFIILFQSFSIPAFAAIQPWEGKSWEGNPWTGDPWDGADLKWEGDSWEGNPWEGSNTEGNDWDGKGTDGNGTTGEGWNGYDWSSTPWYLDPWLNNGWSPNGFTGNGTNGSPFTGDGTSGNPFSGNGTNGEAFTGDAINGSPFSGNGTNGNPFTGLGTNGYPFLGYGTNGQPFLGYGSNYKLTEVSPSDSPTADDPIYSGYDWMKFAVNDLGIAGLQTLGQSNIDLSDLGTWNTKSKTFYLKMLESTFKFSSKDIAMLELGADSLDVGKNVKDFRNNMRNLRDTSVLLRNGVSPYLSNPQLLLDGVKNIKLSTIATSTAQLGSNTYNAFKSMAPLGKLNVIGATVGAGFSAVDTFQNTVKLFNADTGKERVAAGADLGQSTGSLLMNVGTGVAAFPGGQVVGGALIAGGAALWLGGTVVKHWGTIKNAVKHPVKTVKKLGKGIADKAKKGWKTVKGWFS